MILLPAPPIVIPLAGAIVCMLFRRSIALQKAVALVVSLLLLLVSVFLMVQTRGGSIAVMNLGGWPAPFGISLVVDMLSSVMLVLTGLLAVAVAFYACFDLDEPRIRHGFFPLMLILLCIRIFEQGVEF